MNTTYKSTEVTDEDIIFRDLLATYIFESRNSYADLHEKLKAKDCFHELLFMEFQRANKFFPNDIIFKILNGKEYTTRQLRWFIPIGDILIQFAFIEAYGVKINKSLALIAIAAHIDLKIATDTLIALTGTTFDDGVPMNKASKKMRAVSDKRKKGNKILKWETYGNHKISFDIIAGQAEGIFCRRDFLNLLDGKTEFILRICFQKYFDYKGKLSQRKFYIIIYELFRILSPDISRKSLPVDEDEFLDLIDPSQASWDSYRAKRIKTLLFKK